MGAFNVDTKFCIGLCNIEISLPNKTSFESKLASFSKLSALKDSPSIIIPFTVGNS
jgi:hypothetical protein